MVKVFTLTHRHQKSVRAAYQPTSTMAPGKITLSRVSASNTTKESVTTTDTGKTVSVTAKEL